MKNLILRLFLLSTTITLCSCIGLSIEKPKDTTIYRTIPLQQDVEKIGNLKDISVNVFEVRIPSYMARNQIVLLSDKNPSELLMSDSDIWAEPIQNTFTRTIICYLAKITSSNNIQSNLVSTNGKNAIALKVNILECIGSKNGLLNFKVQYTIVDNQKTISNIFDYSTNVGSTYSDYTNSISKALVALSLDICKKISELNK